MSRTHLWGQGGRTGTLAAFQSVLPQQPATPLKPKRITTHPTQYLQWPPAQRLTAKILTGASRALQALCPWLSWLIPQHFSRLLTPLQARLALTAPQTHRHMRALMYVLPLRECSPPKVHLACSLNPSPPLGANLPLYPTFLCLLFLFITLTI